MREIRTYGSVRGAAGNGGPYRDKMNEEKNMSGDPVSIRGPALPSVP